MHFHLEMGEMVDPQEQGISDSGSYGRSGCILAHWYEWKGAKYLDGMAKRIVTQSDPYSPILRREYYKGFDQGHRYESSRLASGGNILLRV